MPSTASSVAVVEKQPSTDSQKDSNQQQKVDQVSSKKSTDAVAAADASGENGPLKQVQSLVDKKIRNLEKRKGRLEGLKKEAEESKKALNEEQKKAIRKFEDVVEILDFFHDFKKSVNVIIADAGKELKVREQKERMDRVKEEKERLKSIITLQVILAEMGNDNIRSQLLKGYGDLEPVTDERLKQFDELYLILNPVHSDKDYPKQLEIAADKLLSLVEGRSGGKKDTVKGASFLELRTSLLAIQKSGILSSTTPSTAVITSSSSTSTVPKSKASSSSTSPGTKSVNQNSSSKKQQKNQSTQQKQQPQQQQQQAPLDSQAPVPQHELQQQQIHVQQVQQVQQAPTQQQVINNSGYGQMTFGDGVGAPGVVHQDPAIVQMISTPGSMGIQYQQQQNNAPSHIQTQIFDNTSFGGVGYHHQLMQQQQNQQQLFIQPQQIDPSSYDPSISSQQQPQDSSYGISGLKLDDGQINQQQPQLVSGDNNQQQNQTGGQNKNLNQMYQQKNQNQRQYQPRNNQFNDPNRQNFRGPPRGPPKTTFDHKEGHTSNGFQRNQGNPRNNDNYNRNGSFGKGASGGPRNDNNNQSFQRQQDNRGPRVPRGPGGPTGGQNRSMPQAAPSGGNFQK